MFQPPVGICPTLASFPVGMGTLNPFAAVVESLHRNLTMTQEDINAEELGLLTLKETVFPEHVLWP